MVPLDTEIGEAVQELDPDAIIRAGTGEHMIDTRGR